MDPLRIFSKYTPASPDEHVAASVAANPTGMFTLSLAGADLLGMDEICTMATPTVRIIRAPHLVEESFLSSRSTDMTAVERILS